MNKPDEILKVIADFWNEGQITDPFTELRKWRDLGCWAYRYIYPPELPPLGVSVTEKVQGNDKVK